MTIASNILALAALCTFSLSGCVTTHSMQLESYGYRPAYGYRPTTVITPPTYRTPIYIVPLHRHWHDHQRHHDKRYLDRRHHPEQHRHERWKHEHR